MPKLVACLGLGVLTCGCSSGDDEAVVGFAVTVSDPGVIQGGDTAVPWTVNGVGFVSGATVTVDEPGVTLANVTIVSETEITFDLTAPSTVASGTAQVIVTDPNMGTTAATVATIPQAVTFAALVQPIFTSRCAGCHTGGAPPAGLVLTSGSAHAAVVGVASSQVPALSLVDAANPELSYVVDKITGTQAVGARMPPVGGPLTLTQIALIRAWISAGALDD